MRIFFLLGVAAAAIFAAQAVSPAVLAQDQPPSGADDQGTLIQIGPEQGAGVNVRVDGLGDRRDRRLERRLSRQPGFAETREPFSRFWIGLGGGPVPAEVRAQLPIDVEQGILVRTIAPESPAAEAGIETFDIVVRAEGQPVGNLPDLAELVGKRGEAGEPLHLELLRRGQTLAVSVTPIERPLDELPNRPELRERLGLFGPEGPFGLNGMEGFGDLMQAVPQMASGISVSVSKVGEGPAKVTVQRGEQTWEFDQGDEKALAALPDDVRPMVEQMLSQNGGAQPGFEGFGMSGPGFQMQLNGADLAGRMRAFEERMRNLREQFGGEFGAAPRGAAVPEVQPQQNLDEAPAFNADDAPKAEVEGPTELDIPATSSD